MDVLIVEDDDGAAEALRDALGVHGFRTRRVSTGAQALDSLTQAGLVLLALGLPDLDGHEVCRRIREVSCIPVIALSGRTEELERVMALHMGADDFVAKPFSRRELVARIRSLLRRAGGCAVHGKTPAEEPSRQPVPLSPVSVPFAAPAVQSWTAAANGPGTAARSRAAQAALHAGPVRLDPRTRKVFVHDEEVRVTRKEFDLLTMLLEEPGTVVERSQIMSRVWDENWFGPTRTLDVHVGSLRTKLGNARWIETVRGVGYRMAVPAADGV